MFIKTNDKKNVENFFEKHKIYAQKSKNAISDRPWPLTSILFLWRP